MHEDLIGKTLPWGSVILGPTTWSDKYVRVRRTDGDVSVIRVDWARDALAQEVDCGRSTNAEAA